MSIENKPTRSNHEERGDFEAAREHLHERLNQEIATEAERLRLEKELLELENIYLKRELERLRELSTKDPLTELENRRGFEEEVGKILPGPERDIPEKRHEKGTLSFLLLDIDNFKQLNDRYGHEAGDKILKAAAEFLRSKTRERDIISRWGGEEFLVVWNDADEESVAKKFWNEERRQSEISFETEIHGETIMVTMSGGLTEFTLGEPIADSIERADKALYASKRGGKNRITRYEERRGEEKPYPLS